ncbi:MAG: type II secretion system protein GspD [Pseudomonadota bacterium]
MEMDQSRTRAERIVWRLIDIRWLLYVLMMLPFSVTAQDESLVSNVFVESDLRIALEDVAVQTGENIIAGPGVQGLVTVELEEVTVDKALELLLVGTEFQVYRAPDYYLVFSPDETSTMFPTVAETHLVPMNHVTPEAARELLPVALQRYVRVDSESSVLAVTAPDALLELILADLAKIDVADTRETRFISLQHVNTGAVLDLLPEHLQRYVRANEEQNTVAVTAPPGSLEQILAQLSDLDTPGRPRDFDLPATGRTRLVKLNHASAVMAMDLLPEPLHEYVRANEESNTLTISAPVQIQSGILEDIAAIDMPRQHVMLDARVVVLEQGSLLDFGVDWGFPTATAGAFTNDETDPSWLWGLRIGFTPGREFTNALSLALNMLTQNEEATIIASPQVMTQDGKEAEISVVTEEWFQITTEGSAFVRSQLEQIETGTVLRIIPQVGADGELTLDMNIEVSDVVGRGAENLPVVSRRTALSTVQVESGGTAAVAGLVDTRSRLTRSAVPTMGRLPLLGRAFRGDNLTHEARQVAVFVTATLVEDRDTLFTTGRGDRPPMGVVDEAEFRAQLETALNRLDTESSND